MIGASSSRLRMTTKKNRVWLRADSSASSRYFCVDHSVQGRRQTHYPHGCMYPFLPTLRTEQSSADGGRTAGCDTGAAPSIVQIYLGTKRACARRAESQGPGESTRLQAGVRLMVQLEHDPLRLQFDGLHDIREQPLQPSHIMRSSTS